MILLNRGVGKDWAGPFFPPLLFSNLSIYLSVLRFNLLLHCIQTLMIVLSKEKFKLRKHLANSMFLLNSWEEKDWAGPFSPPPPPLGSNLSIYLSVLGLNYS